MGHDVLVKRCGCGALLKARQSCAKCADAARARLHAAGVCDSEFSETLRIVKRVGRDPNELHEKSARDICNEAVRSGELVLRERELDRAVDLLSKLAYQHEPPPVGAEVPWSVALADMRRRPEARYRDASGGASVYAWTKAEDCDASCVCYDSAWAEARCGWRSARWKEDQFGEREMVRLA